MADEDEAVASPMLDKHAAEWMILYVCPPGQIREPAGILLVDTVSNLLLVRTKTELTTKNEDIAFVWNGIAQEIARVQKFGAKEVLHWLETTASHTFQISERQLVHAANLAALLDELYSTNVAGLTKQ